MGSKSSWIFLVFIVVGFVVYNAADQAQLNAVRPPGEHNSAAAAPGLERYDWPRAADGDAPEELAPDLTTKNYYVIFDGSGSMAEQRCSGSVTKLAAAKTAVGEFAGLVPPRANLGLLAFDKFGTSERVALAADNREEFAERVQAIKAMGQTPLRKAVTIGVAKLEAQARRQLGYGEYHLIVVTDGQASSGEDPTGIVNATLQRSPLVLHTIGFCIGKDHSLNQPGRTIYKAADSPEELLAGLGDVLAESEAFDMSDFQGADPQ